MDICQSFVEREAKAITDVSELSPAETNLSPSKLARKKWKKVDFERETLSDTRIWSSFTFSKDLINRALLDKLPPAELESYTSQFIQHILQLVLVNLKARNISFDQSSFDSPGRWKLWLEHTGQHSGSIPRFLKWLDQSQTRWTTEDILDTPYPTLLCSFLPDANDGIACLEQPMLDVITSKRNLDITSMRILDGDTCPRFYPQIRKIIAFSDNVKHPNFSLLRKWQDKLYAEARSEVYHTRTRNIVHTLTYCLERICDVAEDGLKLYGSEMKYLDFDGKGHIVVPEDPQQRWSKWPKWIRAVATHYPEYLPSLLVSITCVLFQSKAFTLQLANDFEGSALENPDFYSCLQNSSWQFLSIFTCWKSNHASPSRFLRSRAGEWIWRALMAGSLALVVMSAGLFVVSPAAGNLLQCLGQVLLIIASVYSALTAEGTKGKKKKVE